METTEDDQGSLLGERAYRHKPPGEWEMHPELLTPGRLLELAKKRGVRVQRDERGVVVVCAECEGQVLALDPSPLRGRTVAVVMTEADRAAVLAAQADLDVWGPSFVLDLGQLLADTVRHGVMRHDDALSGVLGGRK